MLKGLIAKIMLGLACLTSVPQQALRAEVFITKIKGFDSALNNEHQSLSLVNGYIAKKKIENICRTFEGNISHLIKQLLYVRPDNSFGCTVAPQNLACYFTPYLIGLIVGTIFEYLQKESLNIVESGGGTQEEITLLEKKISENVILLNKKKNEIANTNKQETEVLNTLLKERKRLDVLQKKLLDELNKRQKIENEKKLLSDPKEIFKQKLINVLKKELEDKSFLKNEVEKNRKTLEKERTEAENAIKQLEEKESLSSVENLEKKKFEEKKKTLDVHIQSLDKTKWENEYKKFAGIVCNCMFNPQNDDQYCNKQTLYDCFLVFLVYKCDSRQAFREYFEGLKNIFNDKNILKTTSENKNLKEENIEKEIEEKIIEKKGDNFFDDTEYSKDDYLDIKKDFNEEDGIKEEPGIKSVLAYEKLAQLYYDYFIFEAPLPPYHNYITSIPWGMETYPDCGENSARLFFELLIYSVNQGIFDYTLLEEINKNTQNTSVTIRPEIIEFFKNNKTIINLPQRHIDWAQQVCEKIPSNTGVIYNKSRSCDIQGGFFNMVNALAWWFGIKGSEKIEQKNKAKYVFDQISKAFDFVGVTLDHEIPKVIDQEPTLHNYTTMFPFTIQKKDVTDIHVKWCFEPRHFFFAEWEVAVPPYNHVYNMLKKQIRKNKPSEKNLSLGLDLLVLFVHNDYIDNFENFIDAFLSNSEFKPYVVNIACSTNPLVNKSFIQHLCKNLSGSDNKYTISSDDQKRIINNLLPLMVFTYSKPIIEDICKNKKSDFYDSVMFVLDALRDEGKKADALIMMINILADLKEEFLNKYKNHILSLVDQRNKKRVFTALIKQGQATKFKEVIEKTLGNTKEDSVKEDILVALIKKDLMKEFENEIIKTLDNIKDDSSKGAVLETLIEQDLATEFKEVIGKTLGNIEKDSVKKDVFVALIKKGLMKEFETVNGMKRDSEKKNVLVALIQEGLAKKFKELIVGTFNGMKYELEKTGVLEALIQQDLAKEFSDIIVKTINKMEFDSEKNYLLVTLIKKGLAKDFEKVLKTTLVGMKDNYYRRNVLEALKYSPQAADFKDVIEKFEVKEKNK